MTARGGVVLVSEVGGVDDVLRGYAAKLEAGGWVVAMPDLWAGKRPDGDVEAVITALSDFDALGAIGAARDSLPAPRFVMGFCLGGLYARMAACTLQGFSGAVEFYGRIVYPTITPKKPAQPLDLLPGLSCPYQGHFGDADPIAPPEHVDELERRLMRSRFASQVFRYPGRGHAFLNTDRPTWDEGAARTAWARAEHFLDHLGMVR